MNDIDSIKRHIQAFASIRGNKRRLARATGFAESTLSGMERPDWNPRLDTLTALARAMDELQEDRASRPLVHQHVA